MSLLLKDIESGASLNLRSTQLKFQSIIDGLSQKIILLKSNERELIYSLFFKHPKKEEIKLSIQWTLHLLDEIKVAVEIVEHQRFCQSDKTVAVNQLLLRLNREIFHGVYYVHQAAPHLLKFKTSIPIHSAKNYLTSAFAEIYKQTEMHFIHYAMKLKILGDFSEPASDETHKSLILLGKLKEYFQLERQKRPKATNYYDLTNCSIKVVNQARILINCNFGLLKKFKNNEIKMDKKRREDCQNGFQLALKRYTRHHPEENMKQINLIVTGVKVRRVVAQVKLDQSRFNIIYRGLYEVRTNFTINSYNLSNEQLEMSQQYITCDLVKKVTLVNVSQDLSFKNEIDFLKFMRMKKNKRLAEYFLMMSASQQLIDNSIYSKYYPYSLACKFVEWNELLLLRAALQIIQGIQFLYAQKILHRDLKEWNILADDKNNIKIIDFGSTSGMNGNTDREFPCKDNLIIVMSTESYFHSYNDLDINYKSISKNYTRNEYNQCSTFDVYSFGAILSNLFGLKNIVDSIVYRELDFLSKKCQQVNPQDRPRPQQVLIYLFETFLLYTSQNKMMSQSSSKSKLLLSSSSSKS